MCDSRHAQRGGFLKIVQDNILFILLVGMIFSERVLYIVQFV